MNIWAKGLGALLVVAASSGCANYGRGFYASRNLSAQVFNSSAGSSGLQLSVVPIEVSSSFNCSTPTVDNIGVQRGEVATSRNTFVACPAKSGSSNVALMAQTTSFDICAFPVQEINTSAIFVKPDLSTGQPIYQCTTLTRASSQVITVWSQLNFASTNYNALIVIKKEDLTRMLACLMDPSVASNGMQTCPSFSYGAFRPNASQ